MLLAPVWGQGGAPVLVVGVGETTVLDVQGFPKHEVISGDKIEVQVAQDRLILRGREVGQAQLIVWDAAGRPPHSWLVKVVAPGEVARQREQELTAALAADPLTAGAALAVSVTGEQATLSGTAASREIADRAVALAKARVREVVDNIRVESGAPPAPAGPPAIRPGGELLPPVRPPAPGSVPLPAAPGGLKVRVDGMQQLGSLELALGEGRLVTVPTELRRALIADDSIADVVVVPPRQVVVIAKKAGSSTLMVWYKGTDPFLRETEDARLDVKVTGPPAAEAGPRPTQDEIDRVLNQLGIKGVTVVRSSEAGTNQSVLLLGVVDSAAARSKAEQALRAMLPESVRIANLIEVKPVPPLTTQELEQRVADLERLLAEQLPNASIHVRVRPEAESQRLRVFLSGEAAVPNDRLRAESIVAFELGARTLITNDIVTPLPPPPAELMGGEEPGGKARPPLADALSEALESSGVHHERVVVEVFEPRKQVVVRGPLRNDDDKAALLDVINGVVGGYEGYQVNDKALQVKTPRIVTDVEIIELSAGDLQNLGLVYGTPTNTGGATTGGTPISNSNGSLTVYGERRVGGPLGRLDPVAASIRALVQENRARVLQMPSVTVDDGQPAIIQAVTDLPLPSTTTGAGGGTGTSVEFRPVGVRLEVTPTVIWGEPDNRIEMTVLAEVSAIDAGVAINIGGSVIPGISKREASTVVTVNDNEALVIGGLTTESERKNTSRIPLISEIPILGALFRYTDSRKEQTSVVVMITPRIQW
ncbi:MAG: pilus assembly protein N-terminal domain-containing protein [Armatimonadetes bacterium]|nr:pilus assembly protein N-terminal domain-containing protein [Armatimonadota bacterium]